LGLGASLRLDLNPDRTWLTVSLCRLATASQPDGTSVSEDVAAVGGQSPQHHAYRGRLADPVAPEGPVDLSDAPEREGRRRAYNPASSSRSAAV